MKRLCLPLILMLPWALSAQPTGRPLNTLPAPAVAALAASLGAAAPHAKHVWRDTRPVNADGTVNAYVEIARGDRRKWEFDMGANARAIDRMIPADIGGYPVNYGYVPQTVSYDGDPFDALVLGPAIAGGRLVSGVIVGLMLMEDEKGPDSKVVLSLAGGDGRPLHPLTAAVRTELAGYFRRYKLRQPGAFSRVPGWASAADGLAHITTTHAFFTICRERTAAPCALAR